MQQCLNVFGSIIPFMNRNSKTVMVNNSRNINKTNNYLLPQTTEHKKWPKPYGVGNACADKQCIY